MRIVITGAAGMLGARFSRRARNGPDQSAFCRIGKKAMTIDRAAGEFPTRTQGTEESPTERVFGRAHGVYFRSGSPPEKGCCLPIPDIYRAII